MALGVSFWRFWCAAVLANVGDGIRMAAFPLLAASLTDNPAAVAAVVAAGALPWLLTGLLAGSVADRTSARLLITAADATRMLVLVVLIVALLTDQATPGLVALSAFLLGVGETVRDTAAQTAIPRLVPTALLERANGRLTAGEIAGNEFIGPLLGAALFGVGVALPFVANSAALAMAVLLVLTLPATLLAARDTATTEESARVPAGVRAGLAWLVRQPMMRALVVTGAVVALADSAWFSIFVLYTELRLDVGAFGFGVFLAIGALGGLAGAFAAERLIAGRRHRIILGWATAVAAGVPSLLLVAPARWAAVVVVVATSAAFAVFNVAAVSLRHRLVPEQVLGRVTAAWRTVVYGAAAIGALLGGAIASAQSLEAPFVLSGALGPLATVLWWRASRPRPTGLVS